MHIHTPPHLFRPEDIVVSDEGEYVSLRIGNATIQMHYAGAFKISQMLRLHGRRAKKRAGDMGRHWSVMGILDSEPS